MTSKDDIERGFYETAKQALSQTGMMPMEFALAFPQLTKLELAKQLGNRATARGLTMNLFEEAHRTARIRELAVNLLFRKILAEYPKGWYNDEKISTTVKLGSWFSDIAEFAPEHEEAAIFIVRSLASDPPEKGWLPANDNDKRLRQLFDNYWEEKGSTTTP